MAEHQHRRLLALVALAEEAEEAGEFAPYLADGDPAVRRTAVEVLTEAAPSDAGPALARAMGDPEPTVRAAAVEGLRELRELIAADGEFHGAVTAVAGSADPAVRAAVVRLLREHRLGTPADFRAAAGDPDPGVRREAVAGLVSQNDVAAVAGLAGDGEALVRLAVARGLATIGDPAALPTLDRLAGDGDVRVRAAALEGLGVVGCPPDLSGVVLRSLGDSAWEIRKGAVIALGAASEGLAVEPLLGALADGNLDVRKAAVQSLTRWARARPEVRHALEGALDDPDADVRGYARLAL
ncbi:MAG TPA: HEAT repeat domain-containing protein, partial [Acidimicrobiia bacterium]|nr:HEAT repeat domain-containing protein [Acidimicrobiia bacterium]